MARIRPAIPRRQICQLLAPLRGPVRSHRGIPRPCNLVAISIAYAPQAICVSASGAIVSRIADRRGGHSPNRASCSLSSASMISGLSSCSRPARTSLERGGKSHRREDGNAWRAAGTAPSVWRAAQSRSAGSHLLRSAAQRFHRGAGPTTMAEVALRRPRAIRSQIARLTPGLMPYRGRTSRLAQAVRGRSFRGGPFVRALAPLSLELLLAVLGDEVDRPRLQLRQDLTDIFADDADHDQLHAADGHEADE